MLGAAQPARSGRHPLRRGRPDQDQRRPADPDPQPVPAHQLHRRLDRDPLPAGGGGGALLLGAHRRGPLRRQHAHRALPLRRARPGGLCGHLHHRRQPRRRQRLLHPRPRRALELDGLHQRRIVPGPRPDHQLGHQGRHHLPHLGPGLHRRRRHLGDPPLHAAAGHPALDRLRHHRPRRHTQRGPDHGRHAAGPARQRLPAQPGPPDQHRRPDHRQLRLLHRHHPAQRHALHGRHRRRARHRR